MHFGVADTGVTESIKNGQEKRSGNQQQDIQDCRSKHGGTEERALRRADRLDFGTPYCHETTLGPTRFSVERSKNFSSRQGTANSQVPPRERSCAQLSPEHTYWPL